MGWYDDWAEEQEKLEREKNRLLREQDDREIGIISQAKIQQKIDEIDVKLDKKKV